MATTSTETTPTVADLLEWLRDISPRRVLLRPHPGTATEQDVIDIGAREKRLCELVDGVLVEKAVGYRESVLGLLLGYFLLDFVRRHDLGLVAGADGILRLMPGLVRIPDLSFVSRDRLPGRRSPDGPIPDLAVEVLSEGNTAKEMARKREEYFSAGVRLVWSIDPRARTAHVHTSADHSATLGEGDTLDGGDVLPGFALPLRQLFLGAD